jgi:hypothetical protein
LDDQETQRRRMAAQAGVRAQQEGLVGKNLIVGRSEQHIEASRAGRLGDICADLSHLAEGDSIRVSWQQRYLGCIRHETGMPEVLNVARPYPQR